MTIEQKAREIVASQYPEMKPTYSGRRLNVAYLGMIEGLKIAEKELALAYIEHINMDVDSPSIKGLLTSICTVRSLIQEYKGKL
jgi:hypothetical protein